MANLLGLKLFVIRSQDPSRKVMLFQNSKAEPFCASVLALRSLSRVSNKSLCFVVVTFFKGIIYLHTDQARALLLFFHGPHSKQAEVSNKLEFLSIGGTSLHLIMLYISVGTFLAST
jgi:hypothetical protein